MSRAAQNLLLMLIGAAVLWITLGSGEYVNYVRPGSRFLLAPAAVALLVLGAAGLRREWRGTSEDGRSDGRPDHDADHGADHDAEHGADHDAEHGHDHSRGPRVAWLLCLPVLALFLIAPPALGSFTASRDIGRTAQPPAAPSGGFRPLPRTGAPVPMTMGEFIGRGFEAQTGDPASLQGVPVRLTGFVAPAPEGEGGWRIVRLKMACCAGDAVPFPVTVRGLPRPPADTWVQVVGVWKPPTAGRSRTVVQELRGRTLQKIKKPRNPYE